MYLGIDLGTSGIKALLIDEDQRPVGSATAPLDVARPETGWSEQRAEDWISATKAALDALRATHGTELAAVTGVGLSGQMHGATLLDAADTPLRPAILWNDTRSHVEAAELDAIPGVREASGNIVFPGFTAPKLLWVARHEPALFEKVAKVLLPKDYLRLWLTGGHVSDCSDAAGTTWLDVETRDWSETLLAATNLSRDHMPALVEGAEPSGQLRPELAAGWGMKGPVIVAGGGGDNAASAVGLGTVCEGDAFVSLGTSGVLFAANDGYRPKPESAVHTFCHALAGRWHQMGVILSATDALNWYAGLVGEAPEALTAALPATPGAPSPVTFLPYLSGERTPHNDAAIRGAFAGLSHNDDRAALTAAVLEGVAFAIRDSQAALAEAGTTLKAVHAVGGGSRSDYWLKVIANVLGIPVLLPESGDFGAAFGAARLGLMAATGADPDTVATKPGTAATIDPDPALIDAYAAKYDTYKALYPALKGATT